MSEGYYICMTTTHYIELRLKAAYSVDETEIKKDVWPDDRTIALIKAIEEVVERIDNFKQNHIVIKENTVKN